MPSNPVLPYPEDRNTLFAPCSVTDNTVLLTVVITHLLYCAPLPIAFRMLSGPIIKFEFGDRYLDNYSYLQGPQFFRIDSNPLKVSYKTHLSITHGNRWWNLPGCWFLSTFFKIVKSKIDLNSVSYFWWQNIPSFLRSIEKPKRENIQFHSLQWSAELVK